ncbi:hypothetical protein ABPG75_008071 [Micractinium tetrahymenae]
MHGDPHAVLLAVQMAAATQLLKAVMVIKVAHGTPSVAPPPPAPEMVRWMDAVLQTYERLGTGRVAAHVGNADCLVPIKPLLDICNCLLQVLPSYGDHGSVFEHAPQLARRLPALQAHIVAGSNDAALALVEQAVQVALSLPAEGANEAAHVSAIFRLPAAGFTHVALPLLHGMMRRLMAAANSAGPQGSPNEAALLVGFAGENWRSAQQLLNTALSPYYLPSEHTDCWLCTVDELQAEHGEQLARWCSAAQLAGWCSAAGDALRGLPLAAEAARAGGQQGQHGGAECQRSSDALAAELICFARHCAELAYLTVQARSMPEGEGEAARAPPAASTGAELEIALWQLHTAGCRAVHYAAAAAADEQHPARLLPCLAQPQWINLLPLVCRPLMAACLLAAEECTPRVSSTLCTMSAATWEAADVLTAGMHTPASSGTEHSIVDLLLETLAELFRPQGASVNSNLYSPALHRVAALLVRLGAQDGQARAELYHHLLDCCLDAPPLAASLLADSTAGLMLADAAGESGVLPAGAGPLPREDLSVASSCAGAYSLTRSVARMCSYLAEDVAACLAQAPGRHAQQQATGGQAVPKHAAQQASVQGLLRELQLQLRLAGLLPAVDAVKGMVEQQLAALLGTLRHRVLPTAQRLAAAALEWWLLPAWAARPLGGDE